MTQQTNGFSRITVHADDDEVVIQAGIRPTVQEKRSTNDQGVEQAAVEAAPTPARTPVPTVPAVGPATDQAVDGSQPQTTHGAQKAASGPKKKAYHETTADDLDTGPMPVAQKVVIVVAVLLIAGFLVYYNFLR